MLIFLDTEFTGLDQAKPDLISIGLVDQSGREFYAELPESHWTVQCNEWVHFNVLPHLWRGKYVQTKEAIQDSLATWIGSIQEEIVIVTDFAEADFFKQLKPLLSPWPKNLNAWPIEFSTNSLNDDLALEVREIRDQYHTLERPEHHALHDARALFLAYSHAVGKGWKPDFLCD
jgi:hypothetical protein